MGSEPETMSRAAVILHKAGYDVIDLNFACPVRKVMGRCRGGYLLSDPETAVVIMRRVRDVLGDYPLSIKLRRALNETAQAAEWFERVFEEACRLEFAAIAVHGRTVEQKYTGRAKWPFLTALKQRTPARVTLFGSGDVYCAEDALRMYRETGVDGVWIARGAIGNPWIFSEFAALLRGEEMPPPPSVHEQRHALLEHFGLAVEIYGEALASRQMRKIAIKYSKLHPNGPEVWREFIAVKNQKEWDLVLSRHYALDAPGIRPGSVPDAEDVCNVSCEPAAK